MKNIAMTTLILLAATVFSNVAAQVTPPGAGDRDPRDGGGVRGRSNELERIKRDAKKESGKKKDKSKVTTTSEPPKDELALKYDQIKTDYERIQLAQDLIIKAYQGTDKIDYAQISKFSQEINESGVRLNSNLFPAPTINNSDAKAGNIAQIEKEPKTPKSIRELIVNLDAAINNFVTSPMFQNLRAVETTVSEKARINLDQIIKVSAQLDAEAQKTAANEK